MPENVDNEGLVDGCFLVCVQVTEHYSNEALTESKI